MDCGPPGSSVHGILQTRILEWVTIPFIRGSSWPRDQSQVSCTACRFFTIWASREAHLHIYSCIYIYQFSSVAQSCPTLCDSMDCSSSGSSVHGNSPDKITGVDCHALLQGIFQTQGSNPSLMHCRWILYHLSQQGSLRILEWLAHPFRRVSSQPRNWARVSCFAGGFFTS